MIVLLHPGSNGAEVALLQERLQRAGYKLATSHVYDDATEQAVMALQRASNLVVDGLFGPKSFMALMGACQPKHLSAADLVRAADQLGVELASVRAMNQVESLGEGFLPDGRPKILFERHVFYRQLQAHGIDPEPIAAKSPHLCNQEPGGYQGGAAEYQRLEAAKMIHLAAAYESASWGAFQVMGYHWSDLGYESAPHFVAAMRESEAAQLDAFVRFIVHEPGLLPALKARKWSTVAKIYNGPAYARNLYDAKLAQAYAKYAELDKVAA